MKPRTAVPAWGLLVAAVLVLVPLGLRDRLPDPLAVHWTDAPVPDNSMSFTANLVTPLLVWGVTWAVLSAWSEVRYPSQTGGWGFRGFPGTAAIMLRGGECLVIRYRSGGRLAISIDDAPP
jgi:hypothetical protein